MNEIIGNDTDTTNIPKTPVNTYALSETEKNIQRFNNPKKENKF